MCASCSGLLTTVAPAGTWKLNVDALGVANEIWVKPIWNAGLEPAPKTWSWSGTKRVLSTAIVTWRTVERESRGRTTSV